MKLDAKVIKDYIENCEKGRKLSKHTIKAYKIDLRQYMKSKKGNFDKESVLDYFYSLGEKYKQKTVKRKMASLHALFEYLVFKDYIDRNPMSQIKVKIKESKRLPRIINQDNLVNIYKVLDTKKESKNHYIVRDKAVIDLLISTGIRVNELCSLQMKDVNLKEMYIKVRGKGDKERIIFLGSEEVIHSLAYYERCFRKYAHDHAPYFINRYGNGVSDQSIRNMIKLYTKQAGIEEIITPHMFRHTFATMLLEEDVDIRYIQNILGHSSITTTEIYTHISFHKQKAILQQKNPRNHIKI